MKQDKIAYKAGYKYVLQLTYSLCVPLSPKTNIMSSGGYVHLDTSGNLTIYKGYAWDGASGPAIDSKAFMRGSLVHDACYQLIAEGLLPQSARKTANHLDCRVAFFKN